MKTVLAHGVFDILHIGHIQYLESARKLGDKLVVSVTSDQYVNKGPGRPHFSQSQRMKMLKSLSIVDEVVLSDAPSAVGVINKVKPTFYVKGPDYQDQSKDKTGKIALEEAAVKEWGGRLVTTTDPVHSSTLLGRKFLSQYTDEQRAIAQEVFLLGGIDLIKDVLDVVQRDVGPLVAGERIQDVYRFVKPESLSSKSPTISARYVREEISYGGATAIWKHICGFCYAGLQSSAAEHIKIRYISSDTGQRLFEVTLMGEEAHVERVPQKHNLLVVADFGHGYFDANPLPLVRGPKDPFRAVNVQTNSSNYGFNLFHKHYFDYLVMDTREARLGYHDRKSDPLTLGLKAHLQYEKPVSLTLGPEGSALFTNGRVYKSPSFTNSIVDATGAGDAYFAITSLLVKVSANPLLTVFLGNVFAGLKTQIMGNERAVTKNALITACDQILTDCNL